MSFRFILLAILLLLKIQLSGASKCSENHWIATVTDYNSSYTCIQKSFLKVRKLNNSDSNANFYLSLSSRYLNLSVFDTAKIFIDSVFAENSNLKAKYQAHNALAQYYFYLGDLKSSKSNFRKSIDIAHEIGDSLLTYNAIDNLATLFSVSGKYAKELELRLKVMEYKERTSSNESIDLVKTYTNLGQCYISLDRLSDAVKVLKKAHKLSFNINDQYSILHTSLALADAYYAIDSIKTSESYYLICKNLASEINQQYLMSASLKGLADIYDQLQMLDSAENCYLKSIETWEKISDVFQTIHTKIFYTNVLLKKHQYDTALSILNSIEPTLDTIDYNAVAKIFYLNKTIALVNLYEKDAANEYLLKYKKAVDTLNKRNLKNQVAFMNVRFKSKELKALNASLIKDAKTNRLISILIIVTLLLTTTFVIITLIQKRKAHNKIIENKNKVLAIIAHDLKGPVGGLSELLNMMDEDNHDKRFLSLAQKSAKSTHQLLEQLLIWARGNQVLKDQQKENINLFELTKNTIDLLNSNITKKSLNIIINIPKDFEIFALKQQTQTVIRNLINNAIKYTNNNGNITISSKNFGNKKSIKITDNGVGMSKEKISKILNNQKVFSTTGTNNETGTGIGLRICKDFVELQKGEFKIESELNKGTTFEIIL